MRISEKSFIILSFMLVLSVGVFAVNTRQIDVVRKKDVLEDSDRQIVRDFLQQALSEIINTIDFTTISSARQTIVSRSQSLNKNSEVQYQKVFNEEIQNELSNALDNVSNGENAEKIRLNLLLLVKELENPDLVSLAIDYFDSDNLALQYLAVSTVANPEIVEALNANNSDRAQLANDVISKFSEMVEGGAEVNILSNIVDFARGINSVSARELLLKTAEMRMSKYESWTVKKFDVDAKLITALGEKAGKAREDEVKNQLMATMAQLYSYAVQMYAASSEDLNDQAKEQLVNVIVAVENGVISDMIGSKTQNLKKAIERRDMSALISGHDSLLGSVGNKGMLANAVDFYYATDGEDRVYVPKELPTKPQ